MATNIDHEDVLDVRDLAELAIAQKDIIEDVESDEDDKEDATDTLKALAELLSDLGHAVDATNAQEIADAFWTVVNNSSPTLIADDYFTDSVEEDFNDMYGFPEGLPAHLVVDWKATAEKVKADYSRVTFDEKVYFIRK